MPLVGIRLLQSADPAHIVPHRRPRNSPCLWNPLMVDLETLGDCLENLSRQGFGFDSRNYSKKVKENLYVEGAQ
jgi:hypothetical protein